MTETNQTNGEDTGLAIRIRRVDSKDLKSVIEIDANVTGIAKPDYWNDIYDRYATRRLSERFFMVAEPISAVKDRSVLGYMIGEIRTWEFGSEPCGWIFAFAVDPSARLHRIGERLFQEISDEFRKAGIKTMRTMVLRHEPLPMGFFRSEGMSAGPYIQLEKDLND
jgi:GNAT superfamily N-acetyltransferase